MKNLKFDVNDVLSGNMSNGDFDKLLRDINFSNAKAGLPDRVTISGLEKDLGLKITFREDFNYD